MAVKAAIRSIALALAFCSSASAQEVFTYTRNQSGDQSFALGYPVPVPIESLTPVDGFRAYDALHARHQSLALKHDFIQGNNVGSTVKGREIFAYVLSDADELTAEGYPEPSFLITGGVHSREWQSPEVVTGIIERFAERRGDRGLYDYLLENTKLVVIPVLNVDGFLQTQRFPSQVIVGQDPTDDSWPRDGRMRRKNMRGVDEDLFTLGDHLRGVDLNRNNPPFAPSPAASADPNNLVFHGNGSLTEPETRALAGTIELADPSRLRLYTDFHSFGSIFFDFLTTNTRRNLIQTKLISRASRNLFDTGAPHERRSTGSIGSTDEYFADVLEIPAWTHEIEPDIERGGRQYGGFGVTHDGFILPDREIARVRNQIADACALLFYAQAGPPSVKRVTILDAGGEMVFDAEWRKVGPNRRRLRVLVDEPLLGGSRYVVRVSFDKPMRVRDAAGAVAEYPGMNAGLAPEIAVVGDGFEAAADANPQGWLDEPAQDGSPGHARYADDTYETLIRMPTDVAEPGLSEVRLNIAVEDFAENGLDADPATVADWGGGHWIAYESTDGTPGDLGGADETITLRLKTVEPDALRFEPAQYEAFEGALVPVTVVREGDGEGAVKAEVSVDLLDFDELGLWTVHEVEWAEGEIGARTVMVPTADDYLLDVGTEFNNNNMQFLEINVLSGAAEVAEQDARINVTRDNDSEKFAVAGITSPDPTIRGFDPNQGTFVRTEKSALGKALCDFMQMAHFTHVHTPLQDLRIVLADGLAHEIDEENCRVPGATALWAIQGKLTIEGRNSVIRLAGEGPDDQRLMQITPGGNLTLQGVILEGGRASPPLAGGAVLNEGTLVTDNVIFRGNSANRAGALNNKGVAELINTRFVDNSSEQGGGAVYNTGILTLTGATFSGNSTAGRGGAVLNGGDLEIADSTFANNQAGVGADVVSSGELSVGNSIVASDDACATEGGGLIRSLGYNLNPDVSCGIGQQGDTSESDPGLQPLNGLGLHQLEEDSPAINTGNPNGCALSDARGGVRPFRFTGPLDFDLPARCDKGAVEHALAVHRGMWWNPERSGHGIDLQQVGNQLILTWFTYEPDGQPVWYQAFGPLHNMEWLAPLFRFTFDHESMQAEGTAVGDVALVFQDGANAQFRWNLTPIGQGEGVEPFESFEPAPGPVTVDFTAHWAAADLSDWGLTVDTQGGVTIATVYYYDAEGNPRWVQGVGPAGMQSPMAVDSLTGFCPGCDMQARPVTLTPAGTISLRFRTRSAGEIDTDIVYPGPAGGEWQRQKAGLGTLSDPVP